MEKQTAKPKKKVLSFLPKAVSFQNPSFSPARDKRPDITSHKLRTHNSRKGFSGPILSMIPAEARRKPKNSETTQEPTSPKVSCMGQIKQKNRIIICKKKPDKIENIRPAGPEPKPKEKSSGIKKLFRAGKKAGLGSVDSGNNNKPPIADRAPSLNQMRRFASGRDSVLASFDWEKARITPDNGYCSEGYSDGEDDVIIPFSAPILMTGARDVGGLNLEPRKEINLWKRRTMAQPEPLQLSKIKAQ
ncbi:hypothetical protein CASFOL_016918 [Castilleja foliolosa]|uniref:Syringolide-induced protein 14-1-1 n=1 Tax=Castilleja foliolosa TaxID=1961234 RepID=A0ABD3DDI9_9LAMI